jgi:hypothetical protein
MKSYPPDITIKNLFPGMDDAEARRAEDNMAAYLALIIRIYERISEDPDALSELRKDLADTGGGQPSLTTSEGSLTLSQRSNPTSIHH